MRPSTLLRGAALWALLLLAACGNSGTADQSASLASPAASAAGAANASASAAASAAASASPRASAAASVAARPSPSAAPATITAGPDEFINPVIDRDFPDPDTLRVGERYYIYATNTGSTNVQAASSDDLVTWDTLPDALPTLPAWAEPGRTWAPEVTASADGQSYIMYFTAHDRASDKQCIGVATSAKPEGPFESAGEQPLICPVDQGGAIDASSFADEDGARYVLWKNDGNCCGFTTYLYLQRVSDDGLTLQGEPAQLLTNDQAWEGRLVEAPTLWKQDGRYYLFYSANDYSGLNYAIGVASADQITGPYRKSAKPLMSSDLKTGGAFGPGGQDVVLDDDQEPWLVYHSWDTMVAYRRVQIDELEWQDGMPMVKGPDRGPQPRP